MLVPTLKTIIELSVQIARKEAELKELNVKLAEQEKKAVVDMDAEDVTEMTVEDVTFKRDVQQNFSIDTHKWDDERFFTFLKENNLGDVIKTKIEVHAQTRGKILREWVDEGNPLPPYIKQSFYDRIKYPKPK